MENRREELLNLKIGDRVIGWDNWSNRADPSNQGLVVATTYATITVLLDVPFCGETKVEFNKVEVRKIK